MELPNGGDGPATGRRLRRTVGAFGLLVGAVLAVLGSLLPLYEQVFSFAVEEQRYSMTLWGAESTFDIPANDQLLYGVPVVAAAALLVVAAALVLAAPRLPAWLAEPTSVIAIAAAALLTGSVWTMGQLVLMVTTDRESHGIVRAVVGTGTATLVLACVVALAGGLLVQHWPDGAPAAPEPEPVGVVVYRLADDDVEADTPPFGVPVPEIVKDGGA